MERSTYEIISAPAHLRAIRKVGTGGGHVLLLAIDRHTLAIRIYLVGGEWARIDNNTESGGEWFDASEFDLSFDNGSGRITALTLHEVFDRLVDRWKEEI